MKTITGILVASALAVPAGPAAAQGRIERDIERIADYALTLAADALGDLVDAREQGRADRDQRQRDRANDDRGPQYTDTFTKTVRLGRNGRLEVENLSGDIEITGGGGDDAKITATKSTRGTAEAAARSALAATQIDVTERPGAVTISSQPTRGRFGGVEVDYVITVPSGTSVAIRTTSGDVTIKNVAGDIQLNSLSGDVVVADAKPRSLTIDSVSGDVSLEQLDSERLQVNVVSGDILLRGKLSKTGRYELRSHSGDIQVVTDRDAGFEVEAGTFSGDVTSDFSLKLRGTTTTSFATNGPRGPRRNNDIRGTANDGGATLVLHSFSGDIQINRR